MYVYLYMNVCTYICIYVYISNALFRGYPKNEEERKLAKIEKTIL